MTDKPKYPILDDNLYGYNVAESFAEYIRHGEPAMRQRGEAWRTAIGLQEVDGLHTSDYLIHTAQRHIVGDITIADAKQLIDSYYQGRAERNEPSDRRTEEADKVAARITELLGEPAFTFAPTELVRIHRRLFTDIYEFAGRIRDYNITKAEWVLDGATVYYAGAEAIDATLNYDFSQERTFTYEGLSTDEAIEHLARFTAGIWQIHPFGEGNTRTTAVFLIKYLRMFGFRIDNDAFAAHSWFFRNALVRANYTNIPAGIHATLEPLVRFMRFLLLGEPTDLRNRTLHIRAEEAIKVQSEPISEPINEPITSLSLHQTALLKLIEANPSVSLDELASQMERSRSTVKRLVDSLKRAGILARSGARKNGVWIVSR